MSVFNYKLQSLPVELFFSVKKCQKEELICLIAGLQKSILKIGLLRFHQLLQNVNGVVLL